MFDILNNDTCYSTITLFWTAITFVLVGYRMGQENGKVLKEENEQLKEENNLLNNEN